MFINMGEWRIVSEKSSSRFLDGFHVYHLPLEFGWKCLYNQFSNWICLYHLAAMQNGPMIYATVIPLMRPEIYLKSHISRDEGVSWHMVLRNFVENPALKPR